MDITSPHHQQPQTDLSTTSSTITTTATTKNQTKLTKIPKPFSIESLIASTHHRTTDSSTTIPIIADDEQQHHQNNLDNQQIFSQQNLSTTNFIPNFPIYNPWMGYLSHTTNERLSQLFTNPTEFSHFLAENSDISAAVAPTAKHQHNKFSDILLNATDSSTTTAAAAAAATMAAAVAHRDKLAQYFANNVRDGNKFTEFLMNNSNNGVVGGNCDYNNTGMYGSETEQRFQLQQCSAGTDKMIQDRNSLSVTANNSDVQTNFSQLLNQSQLNQSFQYHNQHQTNHQQQQQMIHQQHQQHDKDDDLDSVDTGSELSLTMSPDENQRNAGK